ncbi:MAG: hypothetical protein M5U07_07565 [Xanthobacteraceae bacterium]|nr:hypothetical protein [Xanthobacteraceae bacterium]
MLRAAAGAVTVGLGRAALRQLAPEEARAASRQRAQDEGDGAQGGAEDGAQGGAQGGAQDGREEARSCAQIEDGGVVGLGTSAFSDVIPEAAKRLSGIHKRGRSASRRPGLWAPARARCARLAGATAEGVALSCAACDTRHVLSLSRPAG